MAKELIGNRNRVERKEDIRRAKTLISLLRRDPEQFGALKELGIVLYRLRRFGAAISALARAASSNPDDFLVSYHLGVSLGSRARHFEAAVALANAVRLDPADADARENLAFALTLSGHRLEGMEQLRRVVDGNPNNLQSLHDLGIAEFELGRYSDALEHFAAELLLDPGDLYVEARMAHAHYRLGHDRKAGSLLNDVIRRSSDYHDLNYAGVILNEVGNHKKARILYLKALEARADGCRDCVPTDCDIWMNMGIACDHLGRFDEAMVAYQKALRLGEDSDVYVNLGASYELQGKRDDAWSTYLRALEIDPKNELALRNLLALLPDALPL